MASQVAVTSQLVEKQIEALPGLYLNCQFRNIYQGVSTTEDDQYEQMEKLNQEGKITADELKAKVELAEHWLKVVRDTLNEITNDKLEHSK